MATNFHKLSVQEAQNIGLGQAGSILIDQGTTDQDATTLIGVFVAIQFLEDTVFGTLTPETSQLHLASGETSTSIDANAGAAATVVTFPQGMTIFGRWTTINLASGACIAYVGVG
tara:strand:+ start:671 stop:1015 length:345 start_codon:yes stop_codon:yes gene_type:complete